VRRSVAVTAHRGASGEYPENTAAAFQAAIDLAVDAIEFDVRLTRDEGLVVIHDDSVDRISDGEGRVADMELARILELDAGGERFLTLEQALDLMPGDMRLNVHLKATDTDRDRLVPLVVDELVRRDLLATAFVTGSEANMLSARRVLPEIEICTNLSVPRCVEIGCRILQPANGITTRELVDEAHENGIEVHPFYADDPDEMQRLVDCGVDGILTNHPQRLQNLLAQTDT